MIILELPISSFSKKIMLSEYGPEPMSFPSRDPMFQALCYRAPSSRKSFKSLKRLLNDSVRIAINPRLANHIRDHANQVGYHLFTLHIHRLLEWTYTSVLLNEPASHSIKNFYEHYNIEEDDFQLETAYKRWQRYWKKKQGVKHTQKTQKDLVLNGLHNLQTLKISVPISEEDLEAFITKFTLNYLPLFTQIDCNFKDHFYYQLQAYTYIKIGQRKYQEINEKFGWRKWAAYYRVQRFQNRIDTDPQFASLFNEAANEHFGLRD